MLSILETISRLVTEIYTILKLKEQSDCFLLADSVEKLLKIFTMNPRVFIYNYICNENDRFQAIPARCSLI